MTGKTHLYRHFDSAGRLLYVGISLNALGRLRQHSDDAPWFQCIASVTLETFDNRSDALRAERHAIIVERPLHNKIWNGGRERASGPTLLSAPIMTNVAGYKPPIERGDEWLFVGAARKAAGMPNATSPPIPPSARLLIWCNGKLSRGGRDMWRRSDIESWLEEQRAAA